MPEFNSPNWDDYLEMQYWQLSQAVLLLLNVSPIHLECGYDEYKLISIGVDESGYTEQYILNEEQKILEKKFFWRFNDLQIAIKSGRLRTHGGTRNIVKSDEFVTYVESIGWDIPEPLLVLIPEKKDSILGAGKWPWGEYTNPTLEILADTAHNWWATFDHDDPETAPKQSEVISWLEETHNLSNSDAKSIAKILRHPLAPQGRRKE